MSFGHVFISCSYRRRRRRRVSNLRLIAELRRLGACVVFASFQKVIIATNKSDVKAARDYAKFVVSTVTSRDLFNTLQVRTAAAGLSEVTGVLPCLL